MLERLDGLLNEEFGDLLFSLVPKINDGHNHKMCSKPSQAGPELDNPRQGAQKQAKVSVNDTTFVGR